VQNCQGYTLAGRESSASRLTATYFGNDSTAVGSPGGTESGNLSIANINTFTPTIAQISVDVAGVLHTAQESRVGNTILTTPRITPRYRRETTSETPSARSTRRLSRSPMALQG